MKMTFLRSFLMLLLPLILSSCSLPNIKFADNSSNKVNTNIQNQDNLSNLQPNIGVSSTSSSLESVKNNDEQKSVTLSAGGLFKVITQEQSTINELSEFIIAAKSLAEKEFGQGVILRVIDFDYDGSFFSYGAMVTGGDKEYSSSTPNNLAIFYNRNVKDSSVLGDKIFEDYRDKNNKLVGIVCADIDKCPQLVSGYSKYGEIRPDSINVSKVNLLDIASKYTFNESPALEITGEIMRKKGDIFGRFGKYKFAIGTGKIIGEIFNINLFKYDITKDTDLDGLTDQEEKEAGANYLLKDTDGDGYEDGSEIPNGYNPLGSGVIDTTSIIDALVESQNSSSVPDKSTSNQ